MPHVNCSEPVEADIQTIWRVFLDKVEHPDRYMHHVKETRFHEDNEDYIVRELVTEDMSLTEKITVDEKMGEVRFTLMQHPLFEGYVSHNVIPPAEDLPDGLPVVQVTMNWTPKNDEGQAVEKVAKVDIEQGIAEATLYIKRVAEMWEKNKDTSTSAQ